MRIFLFCRFMKTMLQARLFYALAFSLLIFAPCKILFAETVLPPLSADAVMDYADHLFKNQDYAEAAGEYKKFNYFFPGDPRADRADFQVGMCYFQNRSYGPALAVFTRILDEKGAAGTGISSAFMISRCYEKIGKYRAAAENLLFLEAIFQKETGKAGEADPELLDRIYYQLGWIWMAAGDKDLAVLAFSKIRPDHPAVWQIGDIQADLTAWERLPQKRPLTAGLLSVIPGGGYLYCGRYQDALTAFFINSALIYAAWECFDKELYGLGGIITVIETGFYAGSIYGGISSAHKFNQARKNEFVRDLKEKYHPEKDSPEQMPALSVMPDGNGIRCAMIWNF